MFCKNCGHEISDDEQYCSNCGKATKELTSVAVNIDNKVQNTNPTTIQELYSESRKGTGVLLNLFLGIIGLIIGIAVYPRGTYARKTFVEGWLTTFYILFSLSVSLIIVSVIIKYLIY